jgi:hypothetical protein
MAHSDLNVYELGMLMHSHTMGVLVHTQTWMRGML